MLSATCVGGTITHIPSFALQNTTQSTSVWEQASCLEKLDKLKCPHGGGTKTKEGSGQQSAPQSWQASGGSCDLKLHSRQALRNSTSSISVKGALDYSGQPACKYSVNLLMGSKGQISNSILQGTQKRISK